jgi:hypothetical protein
MENSKTRVFSLEGDRLDVRHTYDEASGIWIGDYPYFEEERRYTPTGRPWKNVTHTDCPFADPVFRACGTCPYLRKQEKQAMIGVCFHESLRVDPDSSGIIPTQGGN